MTKYFYTTLLFVTLVLSSLFFASQEKTAQGIISESIYRLQDYNHELTMDISIIKGKDKVENVSYLVSVIWNPEGVDAVKLGRIDEVSSEDGLIAWFHEYSDKSIKRWVFLNDLGILKEIKNNKANDKVDISDFTLKNDILSEELAILGPGDINGNLCTVIEAKFKSGDTIKIWIDKVNFILHRKEYYTHSGKMYRVVSFENIEENEKVLYYRSGKMEDLKKKTEINLDVTNFNQLTEYDINFFLPKKGEKD